MLTAREDTCRKCGHYIVNEGRCEFAKRCSTLPMWRGNIDPPSECSFIPISTSRIPRWVRLIRMLRQPADIGIGDTVQRIAAKFGGERFKAWAERVGIPCGCAQRQSEWNRIYPY